MYERFEEWLDNALQRELPENMAAFNFNIYEDGDNMWSVELVGTETFNVSDQDWACDEIFTENRDEPFEWEEDAKWEIIQEEVACWITEYLENGDNADILKKYEAVGLGFVDGDIELMYIREEA